VATLPAISGLALRFVADSITGVSNGGSVASWPETSGAGLPAATGVSGKQPTLVTGALNGHSAVAFSGTSQFLSLSGSALAVTENATGYSLFAVVKPLSNGSNRDVVHWRQNSGTNPRLSLQAYSGGVWSAQASRVDGTGDGISGGTITNGSWSVQAVEWVFTAATNTPVAPSGSMWTNGTGIDGPETKLSTGVSSSTAQGASTIGADSGGATDFFYGQIAEILFWPRPLTTAERGQVHSYVQEQYGVTVSDYSPLATAWTQNVTDSAGASDAASPVVRRALTVTDAAGATDASSSVLRHALAYTVTDSAGPSDPSGALAQDFRAVSSDVAGLTDSSSAAVARAFTTTDAIGPTDSSSAPVTGQAQSITVTDGAGLTEPGSTLGRAATVAAHADDGAGLADGFSTVAASATSPLDGVGLTDAFTVAVARVFSATDTAGAGDVSGSGFRHPVTDPVGLQDAFTGLITHLVNVTDLAGLADATSRVWLFRPVVNDWTGSRDEALPLRIAEPIPPMVGGTATLRPPLAGTAVLRPVLVGTAVLANSSAGTATLLFPYAAEETQGGTDG
jgi:hypothetical protein